MRSNALQDTKSSAVIYSQLKEMVLTHAFSPSQQLQPWSLADAFKVSATPVREALIRLNAEGLIVIHPNKGFFMKSLNATEVCELYGLRSQLLKCSVEHIIDNGSSTTIATLVESWQNDLILVRDRGSDMIARLEGYFEDCLRAAGSSACFEVVRNVNERTRYLRSLFVENEARIQTYLDILDHLCRYIRYGKRNAALEAVRDELVFKTTCIPALCDAGLVRAFRYQ